MAPDILYLDSAGIDHEAVPVLMQLQCALHACKAHTLVNLLQTVVHEGRKQGIKWHAQRWGLWTMREHLKVQQAKRVTLLTPCLHAPQALHAFSSFLPRCHSLLLYLMQEGWQEAALQVVHGNLTHGAITREKCGASSVARTSLSSAFTLHIVCWSCIARQLHHDGYRHTSWS